MRGGTPGLLIVLASTLSCSSAAAAVEEWAPTQYRSFAVLLNPFALLIGRYSIDVQWSFVRHHAIVLNPFIYSVAEGSTIESVNQPRSNPTSLGYAFGGGSELGYRFFSGDAGLNGFFIGPSVFALRVGPTHCSDYGYCFQPHWVYGAALDVGGQTIVRERLVIALGGGIELDESDGQPVEPLPRILISIGVAF
jgi:hypothetical protein